MVKIGNKRTTEEYIELLKKLHNNRYDYSLVKEIKSTNDKIPIICHKHGTFYAKLGNHLYIKQGCPKCAVEARITPREIVLARARKIHGDKYDYSKADFSKVMDKTTIICPEHGEFVQTMNEHINSRHGCPECGLLKRYESHKVKLSDFIERAIKVHGNKFDYSKVDLSKGVKTSEVTIICPEHGEFQQVAMCHLSGDGCKKCSGKYSPTNEEYIKECRKIYGDEYDLSKVKYINNSTRIKIKCKKHGWVKVHPRGFLKGAGCRRCKATIGEKRVQALLEKLGIKYEKEYRIGNSRYRYDFHIKDTNILIEYDGELHFIPVNYYGGREALERTKQRDKEKNKLAKFNHYDLIRLNYKELDNLEEVLINKISYYYKYFINGKLYKYILEAAKALNLPGTATAKDLNPYLTKDSLARLYRNI